MVENTLSLTSFRLHIHHLVADRRCQARYDAGIQQRGDNMRAEIVRGSWSRPHWIDAVLQRQDLRQGKRCLRRGRLPSRLGHELGAESGWQGAPSSSGPGCSHLSAVELPGNREMARTDQCVFQYRVLPLHLVGVRCRPRLPESAPEGDMHYSSSIPERLASVKIAIRPARQPPACGWIGRSFRLEPLRTCCQGVGQVRHGMPRSYLFRLLQQNRTRSTSSGPNAISRVMR